MESKFEIYKLIPSLFYPRTILITAGTSYENVFRRIRDEHFVFPVIAKPDIGMKGKGVQKIGTDKQLEQYVKRSKVDFLIK